MQRRKSMDGIFPKLSGEQSDLRIVLVGKTGVGKSATGNTILGQKVFNVKQSSKSVTKTCQKQQQRVEDKIISVVDTPGLCDTSMSEEELKKEIVKCVEMSVPGPHVFLLILRPDVRLTNDEKNTVKWIQENFGEAASRYTIVLFTRGDQLEMPIEEFLTEDDEGFKQIVEQCKGGYHVFNNKDKENQSQVSELLEIIDRMVKENGGDHYTNEMYKEAQRKIVVEERKRLAKKVGKVAIAVAGTTAAVTGTALLATATGGLALPIVLTAGGAFFSGGSAIKTVVDKVHDFKENRRNRAPTDTKKCIPSTTEEEIISGGSAVKMVVDKTHDHREERRNKAMGYNVLQDDDESDT